MAPLGVRARNTRAGICFCFWELPLGHASVRQTNLRTNKQKKKGHGRGRNPPGGSIRKNRPQPKASVRNFLFLMPAPEALGPAPCDITPSQDAKEIPPPPINRLEPGRRPLERPRDCAATCGQ